ncbi:nucleotide-diphospho-sugar transferase [Pholiota molesta]|nr:nucleotide-diphospho-sugar transferase [Pholiota molesta]
MAAKSGSSGKEKLIDEEEVLQAVILADSFNKRFRPLTARKPRCLLPICNAPLLDWTFESLALAGVQEVFVVCRSHAELVKNAIKDSKWSKPGSGMKIVPIMTAKETFSPGDAMRDMYTRGLVTSDFVLVMGDLVSNIRIDEVVRVHKERRRTNKDAIMTMVVKESGERHRTRAKGESAVFVLDPETNECLHYEHVQGYPRTKGINIPREVLAAHREVDIRNDLLDCSIDVCSVEVPSLFQDNFDYLDIRRDFVHGILTSDILMKNIYCYVAEDGYAARVQDTRSYESISKDILSRWTFPLVPDDNHPGGHIYELTRGNRYIAKGNTVELSRTCTVGKNTLIGASTTVAENVTIVASVIGQNCRIGAGSTVRNSYLFEGAVIGKGCTVERSIIGADVQIKDRTHVARGCLIGEGVVVGPDAVLQPFERLSKKRTADDVTADEDDDDSDIEEVEASDDASDIEEDLAAASSSDSDSDTESDSSGAFDAYGDRDSISGHSDLSLSASALDAGAGGGLGLMADAEFRTEVTQSLARAFAEGHSVDNAAVELKTLRMASNVPLARVKEAVVAAVVERIPLVEGDVAAQRREIGQVVGRWGDLINRIGGVDPVETVVMLQAHCASSTRMPLFGQILAALYQADIVEEDDIRAWHALPASRAEGNMDDADKERFRKLSAAEVENLRKCWMIGTHMIQQFDAQGSDTETETESEEEEAGKKKAMAKETDSEKDTESETKTPAVESSSGESGSEDEESSRGNTQDGESDDGMSDAVSASEGGSSANPSTNVSANVSEDESEGP